MQFLNLAILLVFGFGTVGLVSHFASPHWLWLIPAYCAGNLLGLAVIWLTYVWPLRARPLCDTNVQDTPIKPVETGS
ncbi:hypothetical protein FHY55_16440 [Oceanicola sp. D3]|nr:hypothetical protein FHY55_16440 [Oceanicola sp. D3]